jgi:predicted permease
MNTWTRWEIMFSVCLERIFVERFGALRAQCLRKEKDRRQRSAHMTTLLQDLRYSLRMMRRNRAFTILAVLTLAIGIGANTTVFSWVDGMLLRPLSGVTAADRLVAVETLTPNGAFVPNSYPDYRDFRDQTKLLSGIAVTHPAAFSVGQQDHAERVWGELVSGNFFSVLGTGAAVGRVFLPEEYGDKPGAFPLVVISDRFWRSHFDANPAIVGKTIRVNQHELTVIGVADPAFHGSFAGEAFDLWVPYMMQPVLNGVDEWMLRDRADRNMFGIARLKPGVTVAQARAELASLATRMAIADADTNQGLSATVLPLANSHFGPQSLLLAPLSILMGVCGVLLLIVCANVANLLLARATVRQKEFSTRLALGAGRARLARQMVTEILLLAITATLCGLLVTTWMSQILIKLLPSGQISMVLDPQLNFHVFAFSTVLCIITTVAAGLFPALQAGRSNVNESLNEVGRSNAGGVRSHRLRSSLVVAEVSLALVALIGAGLFVRGFSAARQIDPGFNPKRVLVSQLYLASNGYSLEQRKEFTRRLGDKLQSAPGITDVAWSDFTPLGFDAGSWEHLEVQGYTPNRDENMKIYRNMISPDYLQLLGIPILQGRNFTAHDDEHSPLVMIVNQAFVDHFFAGLNPIGRRIHGWGEWFTVIGVAANSKYHYLSESPLPYFYVPFSQVYRADLNLAFYVRTPGNPETAVALVRQKAREIDPNVHVFDSVPLSEFIGASLYPQKVAASLLSVLGTLSVVLATVGLYSVLAYSVAQRTREIGIRVALGARPADVLRLVVRQGLSLVLAGLIVGVCFSLAASRSISSMSIAGGSMDTPTKLLAVGAMDPLTYAGAVLLLLVTALFATWIPARRAAAVEPMVALRCD